MTATQPTATQPSTDIYMGISMEFNNQTINLAPRTPINKIEEQGLECGLDKPLNIGRVDQVFDQLVTGFGIEDFDFAKLSSNEIGIPVIDNMIHLVGDADITLERLHVKIPPAPAEGETTEQTTKYTVGASMLWNGVARRDGDPEPGTIIGSLKIKGIYFLATNEGTQFLPGIAAE